MTKRHLPLLCPSFEMRLGATVLGVVNEEGQIDFLEEEVVVDQEFQRVASAGRDPLRRFRFAGPCREKGCGQWTGGQCGVAPSVLERAADPVHPINELPDCVIRPRCRWFNEQGAAACGVCPDVVTNRFVEEVAPASA